MPKKTKDILPGSNPPLKRTVVQKLAHMIEQASGCALTNNQRTIFEAQLLAEWQASKESRHNILASLKSFEQTATEISRLPKEQQDLAWEELGRQLYIYAQKEGQSDPVGQVILDLYQAKHNLLIKGTPPLSQLAAESYMEMNLFIYGLINNISMPLTPKLKTEMLTELMASFPQAAPELQEQISQANMLWRIIRQKWQLASPTERAKYRQELIDSAPPALFYKPLTVTTPVERKLEVESSTPAIVETTSTPEVPATPVDLANLPKDLGQNQHFMAAIKSLRTQIGKSRLFSIVKKE